jgi:hypothetical protein
MEELKELLACLESDGAPAHIISKLEKIIEARALRIRRSDTEDFRRFIERRKKQEEKDKKSAENSDFLMMMLMILLLTETNNDSDEFNIADIMNDQPTQYSKFKQ